MNMLPLFENTKVNVVQNNNFVEDFDVLVACEDTLKFLETIPDKTVELVVSSPPYNIGKSYEDRTVFKEYLGFQKQVIEECHRVLKSNGNFCWEVGNYMEKGEV